MVTGGDMSLLDYHTGPVWNLEPPCTIEEYIANYDNVDWLDAARFAAIDEGPPGVEKRGNFLYRYGAWLFRWRHWAVLPRSLRSTVISDMIWACTRSEMYYVRHMRPIVDDGLWNVVTYLHVRNIDVPLSFDRFERCYWYQSWAGLIDDTSFERRLRHRNKWEESVFTG